MTDQEFDAMFPDFDRTDFDIDSVYQLVKLKGKSIAEAVDIVLQGGNIEDPEALGWGHFPGQYFEVQALDSSNRFKDVEFKDDAAIEAHRRECGCPWPEVDYQARFCSQLWSSGCSNELETRPQWPTFVGDMKLKRKFQTLYGLAEERKQWEHQPYLEQIVSRTAELLAVLGPKKVDATAYEQEQRDKLHSIVMGCWEILTKLAEDVMSGHAVTGLVFTNGDDWEECERCGRGIYTPTGAPSRGHFCPGTPVKRLPETGLPHRE